MPGFQVVLQYILFIEIAVVQWICSYVQNPDWSKLEALTQIGKFQGHYDLPFHKEL